MTINQQSTDLQPSPEQPRNLRLMLKAVDTLRTVLVDPFEGNIFVKDYKNYWVGNIDRCLNTLQDPLIVNPLSRLQVLSLIRTNPTKTERLLKFKDPIIIKNFDTDSAADRALTGALLNLNDTQLNKFTIRLSNNDCIVSQDVFLKIVKECEFLKKKLELYSHPLIEIDVVTPLYRSTHDNVVDYLKKSFNEFNGYLVSSTYTNIPFYRNEATRIISGRLVTTGLYSCSI